MRARAAASLAGKNIPKFPGLLEGLAGKGGADGLNWRQVVLSAAVGIVSFLIPRSCDFTMVFGFWDSVKMAILIFCSGLLDVCLPFNK